MFTPYSNRWSLNIPKIFPKYKDLFKQNIEIINLQINEYFNYQTCSESSIMQLK